MSINIIDPNLTGYLKTINTLAAASTGQTATGSGTSFYELLSTMMSGINGGVDTSTGIGSYLDSLSTLSASATTVNLDDIFQQAADTYNVPVNLLKAVAKAESNFDATAESSAGAQGIMQLMPSTAESLGVTNAFDPEQNIMGGANYLSQMLSQVNGNVELALAAYNAGPGNVEKYNGIPPFEETRNYITKVLDYCSENLTAGIVTTDGTVAAASGNDLLSGITAKDISTMMSLYQYQSQLSVLNMMSDSSDDSDSNASYDLFSGSMSTLL